MVEKFKYFPEEFEESLKRVKLYNKKSVGKSGAYVEEAMSVRHLPTVEDTN